MLIFEEDECSVVLKEAVPRKLSYILFTPGINISLHTQLTDLGSPNLCANEYAHHFCFCSHFGSTL